MIPNHHNKGGQSSARFGRIADNIRNKYIITIVEKINKYLADKSNNWIFGSNDIMDDVFSRNTEIRCKLNRGGHIEFDRKTIDNVQLWLQYLKQDNTNDNIMKDIVEYLDKGILITFDHTLYDMCEYIITNGSIEINDPDNKVYKLGPNSKFYGKLRDFNFIGKLYYELDVTHYNEE
jgi:hypothetical protein